MQIKVFTTSTCPYCQSLKRFLEDKNVSFEEAAVDQNPAKLAEMREVAEGFSGVPFVVVTQDYGDIVKIKGFDREKLEEILGPTVKPPVVEEKLEKESPGIGVPPTGLGSDIKDEPGVLVKPSEEKPLVKPPSEEGGDEPPKESVPESDKPKPFEPSAPSGAGPVSPQVADTDPKAGLGFESSGQPVSDQPGGESLPSSQPPVLEPGASTQKPGQ